MSTENGKHATRLTIAEAANQESAHRVVYAMKEHIRGASRYMVRGDVLLELEGNMVIMTLEFDNSVEAMRYSSDRWYRQFVEQTQHLLLGSYVTKLLSNERDQKPEAQS